MGLMSIMLLKKKQINWTLKCSVFFESSYNDQAIVEDVETK